MSMSAIVARRQKALVSAWIKDPTIPVIQPDGESVRRITGLLARDFELEDTDMDRVGRRKQTDAVIVSRPGVSDNNATLWVRAGYDYYRNAYRAFIKQVYGVTVSKANLSPYDADHLLNRAQPRIIRVHSAGSNSLGNQPALGNNV